MFTRALQSELHREQKMYFTFYIVPFVVQEWTFLNVGLGGVYEQVKMLPLDTITSSEEGVGLPVQLKHMVVV